jgi:hypothetical protein
MSRCIDLFINAPAELDEFSAELAELTRLDFIEDAETSRYLTRQGDVLLMLGEHDFVDDRHLPLSRYRYDLYARISTGNPLDSPEARLLRDVLSLVRVDGRHPALLVFDLQRVIDRADGSESAAATP